MKPKSNTLVHFTKSSEKLKLILKNVFWPRYCLEDIKWLGYEEFDYIAYPMVCFCDIPLSRISEHIDFYGGFGVGVTRQWAHANGLNPVLYTAGNNHIVDSFRELNDQSNEFREKEKTELAKTTLRYLLAHSKPTSGTMVVDGKPVNKDFYQESEWRYVPKHKSIEAYFTRSSFDDRDVNEKANSLTKENCIIKASPQDIRYIFVRSDSDIPSIINFLQTELDHFPNADLKILMSRVVSLESLTVDI